MPRRSPTNWCGFSKAGQSSPDRLGNGKEVGDGAEGIGARLTGISAASLLLIIAIAGPTAAFRQATLKRDAERARDDAQFAEDNTARALKKETAAKGEARRAVFDLKTSFGFAADRELKHSEALLWFADAAASVEPDSLQYKETLIRLRTWKRLVSVPLLLLQHGGESLEGMEFDLTGRYLATLTKSGVVSVWDS